MLEQALINLASNAMAATGASGHVRIAATANADTVRIAVVDDGPGFKEADLERIFDRFYRAAGPRTDSGGGSGLGLAIARRLVELHGGRIAARNLPEGGAEVAVELPRAEPG